jgi:hypothetical protein
MTVPARTAADRAEGPRPSAPLATSVRRTEALPSLLDLRFGLPAEASGWVICSDLLREPERFDAWRKTLAEWLVEQHGDAPERTTAGYVMSWYLNVPGFLAGVLFHTARRVPSLRPSDIAFRLADSGRPHPVSVAVLSDEFACLPDDPEGNDPAATVVAHESALAALLRARFAAHAAKFVQSFGPTVRLGRRMLWAAATDALDGGPWSAGRLCGDEASGVADSAMLLPAKLEPFTSASTLRSDGASWTRRRESCCFHYVLPGVEACASCPRVQAR